MKTPPWWILLPALLVTAEQFKTYDLPWQETSFSALPDRPEWHDPAPQTPTWPPETWVPYGIYASGTAAGGVSGTTAITRQESPWHPGSFVWPGVVG